MKRWESDIANDMVQLVSSGVFDVQSSAGGNRYKVIFGDDHTLPKCTCLDWRRNKLLCKHFCACMKAFPEWGWENLSKEYKRNPLFCLDETIVPPDNNFSKNTNTDEQETIMTITGNQPPAQKMDNEDSTPLSPPEMDNKDFRQLPPKRATGKNALRLKCRNIMKLLSSLTFLLDDKQQLSSLANDLEEILEKAQSTAPQEAGIIIQNSSVKKSSTNKRKHHNKNGQKTRGKFQEINSKKIWTPQTSLHWLGSMLR